MVRDWTKLRGIWPPRGGAQIRLVRRGCVNRPFYQIGVMPANRRIGLPAREVIGSFDPMSNERGEKLVSLDMDRFYYWLGHGVHLSRGIFSVLGLLFSWLSRRGLISGILPKGLCGVLPIHPYVYREAWLKRMEQKKQQQSSEEQGKASNSSQ